MKKWIVALVSVFFCIHVFAAEIAVVDFRAALLQSDAGKEAAKAPRQQIASMEARLKKENEALKQEVDDLKRDELTLAPDELASRRQALAQRQAQVRNMAASMQQQAQQMEQQLIQQLSPKGESALKQIIAERKLDAIISRQAVIFSNNTVDITAELIQKLNEEK